MARAKGPKPGEWRHDVDDLTAYERADRGYAIYTRRWLGKRYGERQRLCDPIRTPDGRIDHDRARVAINLAVERQKRAAAGLEDLARIPPEDLTLSEGFRLLLHAQEGKYAADTDWKRAVDRYREDIVRFLGASLKWSELRTAHYRKLWRALANEHVRTSAGGRARYGPRATEVIVGALQSAARWLRSEEMIEDAALPPPKWRSKMREEWAAITKRPVTGPAKPRHTRSEQAALWRALPQADPRLRILLEIGAELRLGQVVRSKRSDVIPHNGFRAGAVRVHGRGKKHGELVVLSMEQRHALLRAMTRGVLADLEAAYQRGTLPDYFLVPGGKLRTVKTPRGPVKRVPVERGNSSYAERTALRKWWAKLERLAGVKPVHGRKWYGLRRLHADMAEDVEKDARVLNLVGGWTDTATREKYQEEGRIDLRERAATVRRQIRPNSRQRTEI